MKAVPLSAPWFSNGAAITSNSCLVKVPSAWKKAAALESWPTESLATASDWCAARIASSCWLAWKSALSSALTISAAVTEPAAISSTAARPIQKRSRIGALSAMWGDIRCRGRRCAWIAGGQAPGTAASDSQR